MLPSAKTPPRTSLSDLTVLAYGLPKAGKCVKGDTVLIDPNSGRPKTIREVVETSTGDVLALKEAGCIAPSKPSHYLANEPARLYRLATQTGREIEATANHPFLTRNGWKELRDLTTSDRVAVVAEYPSLFGNGSNTDDDLVKIMAYLIADGTLAEGSSPIFTKDDPEVRADFEAAVEAKGDECAEFLNDKGVVHVRVRGKSGKRNNVIVHLKEVGLHGLTSRDKFIPEFVFGLQKRKLALFLNRLFTCDGSVESSGRISFSSTSVRMVRQVQHLLLRFGIVSLIREKRLNGEPYGADLIVSSKSNVLRFVDEIGFFGEKACRAEAVRASLYNVRAAETQLDRVGPVLFDRVVSVTPTTVETVYDLTVPGHHNFIANDFIVHNSTFCSNAEGALFLATEAGLNSLEVFQQPISSWEEFLQACREIAEGAHPFKTVVVDTVDNAYRLCTQHTCAKHKIEHESDLGYGKGWAMVNNEFHRVLNKLAMLPYGLFMISHAQEREIETRVGKYTKTIPTLPDKARKIVLGMADMILFCDLDAQKNEEGKTTCRRVLRAKPSLHYEAGDRTGRLPEIIDLDYRKFIDAFNGGKPAASAAPPKRPATSPAAPPAAKQTKTEKKEVS